MTSPSVSSTPRGAGSDQDSGRGAATELPRRLGLWSAIAVLVGTTIEINTKIRIMPKAGGGLGVSVDKNESALVKTAADGVGDEPREGGSESDPDRPRRRKRRRDD